MAIPSKSGPMKLIDCHIIPVGRRRDGGTRYWCLEHQADATAKYGRRSRKCRYAGVPAILPEETRRLDVTQYPGGVGIWGAVPPVYDTTRRPVDKGIHLHARMSRDGHKIIDHTFRRVEVVQGGEIYNFSELDAIYFMVSSVFDFPVKYIECTRCRYPHLDKDWFSVHPHQSHLCAGCGRTFRDSEVAIGNPLARVHALPSVRPHKARKARKTRHLRQADYPGGIQIWGSNPAVLWTSEKDEEIGIHVHAYEGGEAPPVIDDTFMSVSIDGVILDIQQVCVLMAQTTLPHLAGRVTVATCGYCGSGSFDSGENAYSPRAERECARCTRPVRANGRFRNVVSNPLIGCFRQLAVSAPRSPQIHDLGLLAETL